MHLPDIIKKQDGLGEKMKKGMKKGDKPGEGQEGNKGEKEGQGQEGNKPGDGQKGGNCSDWHTGNQCLVHSGFLGAWYSVAEQVLAHLNTLQCRTSSGTQLAITGHSLGAAMAALAA
jgi:hypothetical protein